MTASQTSAEFDEIRQLRIDNARLRDENFMLRRQESAGLAQGSATREQIARAIHDGLGGDGWAYSNYGGDEWNDKRNALLDAADAVLALRTPAESEKPGFNAIKREQEICALEAEVLRLRAERDDAVATMCRLNSGEELQSLMRLNNQLLEQVEIADQKREFAEFEWNRATDGMKERDATIAALKARITELEANEAAYESILGKRTYNEVAEHIRELEEALKPFVEIAKELQPHLETDCKNTMHWAVPTVGQFRSAAAALSHAGPVARDGER